MKYKMTIEGGFVGIPKTYQGEHRMDNKEKSQLIHHLQKTSPKRNTNARDALTYHLELTDQDRVYNFEFDEFNIPKEVRMFINSIIKK
ncbi:hypothetical protein [Arenibacter lacus]|uniref:hypothetical protein n=1 Tax=Arenibacter lacus TaxID=2608629 RepID=UPI00123D24A3|nr:hypothetical protein [Arenibacter lacus]